MPISKTMFDRILIPTDGGEAASTAAAMGIDLAESFAATVHGLYVVNPQPIVGFGIHVIDHTDLSGELAEEGERVTEEIVTQATDAGVSAKPVVREGRPSDEILSYTEAQDIDLIVMGTHGRTGIRRALMGSVTERVVRHAEIPVMTVRGDPESGE